MPLVTISAQYGAGGSKVAPAVAAALGVPFIDRAIPVQVARELGVSVDESLAHDDRAEGGRVTRWLAGVAQVATLGFAVGAVDAVDIRAGAPSDQAFVTHTEDVIRELAGGAGGVILGRAAALVLADEPQALHVRLHGPRAARLRQAVALRGIDEATADQEMAETDAARSTYVKRFYHHDPEEAGLYHLLCDSTAISLPAIIGMVTSAARGMV
jgi:cytidylate kinase